MKARLAKLIDVKSLVTLALTIVFCVLSIIGAVPTEFLTIYTVVIGFYFGTQAQKNATVASYTGPQQGQTEGHVMPIDAGHPPDSDTVAQIGFER